MAVKCAKQVGLFWGSPSSFDGAHSHIWSDNADDIARNLNLPFSPLTVIYSPIWSVWMCEKGCVGRQGRGTDNVRAFPSISKRKGWLYWTTRLSVSTSVPLTVNPESIALRRPTGPLPFFLPGLFPFFRRLLLRLPLFLSAQMPQADWQHIKWNKAGAVVSDRS